MATWGQRRQWIIEGGFVALGLLILAGVLIAVLYKAPSCMDGKQNQGEQGIDCGGPCPYLCSVDENQPVVRFAKNVSPTPGRTDVIAYIDNPNANGGVQHAAYTLQLYGTDGTLLAQKNGTINLPPSMTAPLFVPSIYSGGQVVAQTFLTLDAMSLKWLRNYPIAVVASTTDIQIVNGDSASPRVTATLQNPTAHILYGLTVTATVFDANNNAIAASQTVVTELPAQGSVPIIFTWNQPFGAPAARVEILPTTGS